MSNTILDVTTGVTYATVSDAITLSGSGDLIQIPAGTYSEDFPKIRHDLTLQGVGGLAHLQPVAGQQPSNGQAILVTDANVTLESLELSGATVPEGNGAGVREETGNLTVVDSWIHGNQDGILTGALPGAVLTISRTEFSNNGAGDGLTHNLYVGEIATLDISDSYFTAANGGHEIKSRAATTIIRDSRIQDGPTADTSYSVDLPNGGMATIENNVIEKGPNSPNNAFVHFGGEVATVAAGSGLVISGNTVLNDKGAAPFVFDQAVVSAGGTIVAPSITGNTFYGLTADKLLAGPDFSDAQSGARYAGANSFLAIGGEPALDTSAPFMPCFRAGTLITTETGAIAVEALRVGDRVLSAFGGTVPVVWIGHGHVDCRRHARPDAVLPVRIRADAFGEGLPQRDLWLSPEHAVHVDDVLIPIRCLVNGDSIRQEHVAAVTYFHVEVPAHDVIFAEGLPAESYLDTGYRGAFANGGPLRVVPDDYAQRVWAAEGCAPHVTQGPIHARVMERLRSRSKALG